MNRTPAQGKPAANALALAEGLQRRFSAGLESVAADGASFEPVAWARDGGAHGGGVRLVLGDTVRFDRASVNVSQVHYDDMPDKRLASATALSTIIHPADPRAPSVHMHISWTQMRDGGGTWRIMADLNPAVPSNRHTEAFDAALATAAGPELEAGKAQGDRYFFIPALGRHRGVSHFYLEGFATDDADADAQFAREFGETMIDAYVEILRDAFALSTRPSVEERADQLQYHSLYFFQVLTLDRGTTSGLLVHDQNDVGILGSLPSHVDRRSLLRWRDDVPTPQENLVDGLVATLPAAQPSAVSDEVKRALAQVIRAHYRSHPEALKLQASGDAVPDTVGNHRD